MLALIFFSSNTFAEIKIAIIDTGFCYKSSTMNPSIKIKEAYNAAGSFKIDCDTLTKDKIQSSKRFHGQRVLNELLSFLSTKENISIVPIIIFNEKGVQTIDAWIKAIDFLAKNPVDYVLSAAGIKIDKKMELVLPGMWFLSSGQTSFGFKKEDEIFPQLLHKRENVFLIGSFFKGTNTFIDNPNLLFKNEIDYYFYDGDGDFKGSSRAVAEALARAINLCGKLQISKFKDCLNKNSKILEDKIAKVKMKTY